jgi:hypothetical protein
MPKRMATVAARTAVIKLRAGDAKSFRMSYIRSVHVRYDAG